MTLVLTKRRLLLAVAAVAGLLLVGVVAARVYLAGQAINVALRRTGATEIRFQVAQASPWRLVVEDVRLLMGLQSLAARRITLDRAHWWTPSFGTLQVEGARVPLRVAELAKSPPPVPATKEKRPARVPFEAISIDGQLVVQADGQPDQALTVRLEAHPAGKGIWQAAAHATGPGLVLKGEGSYDSGSGDLAFKVPEATLDLKSWQFFLQQLIPVSVGDWEVEGRFSGRAEGRVSNGKLIAGGSVQLREGRGASTKEAVTVEGIEADLEFTDFAAFTTKPGTLKMREVRTGKLTLSELHWEFAFAGADRVAVTQASLRALGGRMSAEPFTLVPSRSELDAVLRVEDISVEEVMALTKDLPAKASGRVNGRFPLHLDAGGFVFGTGWLELKAGERAEIEFNAKGLLTGGVAPGNPRYAVLQKIESGLLKLHISELRLDIRPADAPADRSARLHLKGQPVDPEVKAPVILDLNVNGPLEKLLNMGMDSRLSIGTGR